MSDRHNQFAQRLAGHTLGPFQPDAGRSSHPGRGFTYAPHQQRARGFSRSAFALGAWDAQFVPKDQDANGGQMVSTWRNDLPVQNVYWQVGNVYLALITDDETLSKQDLIDLAGGVGG